MASNKPILITITKNNARVFVGTWIEGSNGAHSSSDSPRLKHFGIKKKFKKIIVSSQVVWNCIVRHSKWPHVGNLPNNKWYKDMVTNAHTMEKMALNKSQLLSFNQDYLHLYSHFAGISASPRTTSLCSSIIKYDDNDACSIGEDVIVKGGISNFKAYILLLKSFVGTGVLLLPNAFKNGGMLFSIILFIFIGIYSFWCYYILSVVKVSIKLSCFGEIGKRIYGTPMKVVILFSLILTQLGFASTGIIFVANNMKPSLEALFHWKDIKYFYLIFCQLILYIPLGLITDIKKFSITTMVSNVLMLSGLSIVFISCCSTLSTQPSEHFVENINYKFNPRNWCLFVGTAIFAFEGIGLIIPVQDSMRHPESFPLVLALVITSSAVIFLAIAIIGYMAFGNGVEVIILQSLSSGNILINLLQLLYSFAIMIATPLQNLPVVTILEDLLFAKIDIDNNNNETLDDCSIKEVSKSNNLMPLTEKKDITTQKEISSTDISEGALLPVLDCFRIVKDVLTNSQVPKVCLRLGITNLVVFLAYFGSGHLEKFVAVIGSLFCIPLVYMIPPALHLKDYSIKKDSGKILKPNIYLDVGLIMIGAISMVYTTYLSIIL